ncbi:acyl carrier protein [Nocardia grenadensis]|uniref:acyl carrier protein n=1 Tax=Nocardia grenadensis TaxID=931537 RepID=UPI0007A4FF59|nr:phosphopantetheine-binding protein [Nocardia grenadensis]
MTTARDIAELMTDFDVDLDALRADLPLEDQGVDSMDMSALLVRIERAFHVEISDAEAESLRSLDDLAMRVNHDRS